MNRKVLISFAGFLILTVPVWTCQTLIAQTNARSRPIPNGTTDLRPETVFTNSTPITINDNTTANPYPSTIAVSGLSGTIPTTPGSVKVTINGFSHTFPDDVAMLLVGPTGAALLIQDG